MNKRVVAGILAAGLLFGGCTAWASPSQTNRSQPSGCGGSGPFGASAACATQPMTGAPGGLSRDAAIAAAIRLAPQAVEQPAVIWASIANDPFTRPQPNNRPVWQVRLEGPFAAYACASGFLEKLPTVADPACLDNNSGLIVVLDYFSGALVGWLH